MYLLIDTETTSYHPGQIAQLSYIQADESRQPIQTGNYFFEVDEMDPYAQRVHGFSLEQLRILSGGKRFSHYRDEILPLLENNILVAHNIAFDLKFMQYECERMRYEYRPQTLCTMHHFTPLCQLPHPNQYGKFKRPKVAEVVSYCNISETDILQETNTLFGDSGQ